MRKISRLFSGQYGSTQVVLKKSKDCKLKAFLEKFKLQLKKGPVKKCGTAQNLTRVRGRKILEDFACKIRGFCR
jgi:hypothetical protein